MKKPSKLSPLKGGIIKNKKSTASELEMRIKYVIAMLMQGYSRIHIVQYSSSKWKLTARQTDKYINRAHKSIKKACADSKEDEIALAAFRLSDLYQKNYKNGDYRECRSVQETINKMMGLNAAEKIDHTSKGESMSPREKALHNMTDEELQAKLDNLREKMK